MKYSRSVKITEGQLWAQLKTAIIRSMAEDTDRRITDYEIEATKEDLRDNFNITELQLCRFETDIATRQACSTFD